MAFLAVAREERTVVGLVLTTIVRTDVALLARTEIDDQLVESTTTTNEHVLFSVMDVVAAFRQCHKVAAKPGAIVRAELETNVNGLYVMEDKHVLW
jgi:hypothetical protein